jgi:hypothetical protein
VTEARVILTANDFDFAGLPPLQVTLRVMINGAIENVVVIILHAKCCSDSGSWARRRNAANALKSYLDTNFPTQKVWVIGDFNDDLDTSITPGSASPYANFVNDVVRYRFPTKALSDAGAPSTTSLPDTIDHHLNSNEANATYIVGSVEVFRVDQFIPNYGVTTSDHYPVLTRYTLVAAHQPRKRSSKAVGRLGVTRSVRLCCLCRGRQGSAHAKGRVFARYLLPARFDSQAPVRYGRNRCGEIVAEKAAC